MQPIALFPEQQPNDHLIRLGESCRLGALAATGLLDSAPEEAFDRAVRIAIRTTGAPVALVSLVDDQRQFFKAQSGLDDRIAATRGTPLTHSFCQYVVAIEQPLAVSDARRHPLLRDNPAIADLGVVAYLGVPIRGAGGRVLGSFCAIDSRPRIWTADDLATMKDLAAVLEVEIDQRRLVEERQILLEELNHRVKNLFAITLGMIRLTATKAASVEEFSTSLDARLRALASAQELIGPAVSGDVANGGDTSLARLMATLLEPHAGDDPDRVSMDGPDVTLGRTGATHLALAVHEMATNAAKYGALAAEGGRLKIAWSVACDDLVIDWCERGGPAVDEASCRQGFGTRLIRISIERQLQGRIATDADADGLRHVLTVPLERIGE